MDNWVNWEPRKDEMVWAHEMDWNALTEETGDSSQEQEGVTMVRVSEIRSGDVRVDLYCLLSPDSCLLA